MSKEQKDIEDIFKDSFENFEVDVKEDVWRNVQTGLKGVGIGVLIKTAINKLGSNAIIAITSSAATVLSTVLIINATEGDKTADNKPAVPKTKIEVPVAPKEEIKDFLNNDAPVVIEKKEEKKEEKEETPVIEKKEEKKEEKNNVKANNKEMEAVINALSDQSVASVSASTIGGPVPLIVSFSNNGNGKTNKWDFGDGKKEIKKQGDLDPVHVYDVPGIYTVVLTSTTADGRTAVDNVKIEVTGNSSLPPNSIADTFSPNGDGERDEFILNLENMVEVSAVIFDDKKTILYSLSEKKDPQKGASKILGKWNGNDLKGKPVKEGIYYYIVNCTGVDGKKYEKKGKINLIR